MQSVRDSWLLLAGCCGVLALFLSFRVWVASQIDFGAFQTFLAVGMPKFVEKLLPVPVDVLGTPEGRVAYGFEEFPVIVLSGLWAIARGSECLSGRLSAGTMEMLLAQPIRRFTLFATHTLVTLAGAALVGFASWLGTGLGVAWSSFAEPPELRVFTPAAVNLVGLCVFFAGFTTLLSAVTRTRSQTVALAIGFYV
ncbi:MAG: ABC transporter permease subunit, partial [Planctomycetota bacterium]